MAGFAGPDIVDNGLILALEPSSLRSYSGVGTQINNISRSVPSGTLYDNTFVSAGSSSYFISTSLTSLVSNYPVQVDPASGNGFTICMMVNPQITDTTKIGWNYWFKQENSDASKVVEFGRIGNLDTGWEMKDHVQPYGEQLFTSVGTTSWVVPVGVTSITAVCIGGGGGGAKGSGNGTGGSPGIPGSPVQGNGGGGGGGGGLRYSTNIPVTPGETLEITVGDGGDPGFSAGLSGSSGASGGVSSIKRSDTTLLFAGGGIGGNPPIGGAGAIGGSTIRDNIGGGSGGGGGTMSGGSGGGGAAGYSGSGGVGGLTTPITGGGGFGGGNSGSLGQSGGGVGVYGEGPSGSSAGEPGSGGDTSFYGGGGGGAKGNTSQWNGFTTVIFQTSVTGVKGTQGAVRIVWGVNRSYPSTGVGLTLTPQTQSVSFSGWTFLVCGVTTTYQTFYSLNGGSKNIGTSSDWADSEVITFDNIFGSESKGYPCSWGSCFIYNRELTAEEISKNYSSFKLRYGI